MSVCGSNNGYSQLSADNGVRMKFAFSNFGVLGVNTIIKLGVIFWNIKIFMTPFLKIRIYTQITGMRHFF